MESAERIVTRNGVKYKLVAPEGGWGYMICLSIAVQFIILFAPTASFGFIYNKYLEELHESTSGVTLVFGTYSIALAVSGFMTNVLLKRMTLRQVALLGSTAFSLGNLMGIFVQSIKHIAITNGLLVGIGTGLAFPVCFTSFNTYFTQNRLAYLSAVKVIVGLGTASAPMLWRYLLDEYEFRGTLMIVFAIGLHSFVASAVLQPVDLHLKMVEISPDAEDAPLDVRDMRNKIQKNNIDDERNAKINKQSDLVRSVEKDYFKINSCDLYNDQKQNHLHPSNITNVKNNAKYFNVDKKCLSGEKLNIDDEEYMRNVLRRGSVISIGAISTNIETLAPIVNKKGKLTIILNYFDLSLFKDMVYANICIGIALAVFSDFQFFMLLPLALFNDGWDNNMVAKALALAAGGELAGKVALAITTKLVRFRSRYIFLIGMLCSALFRSVFVMVKGTLPMLVLITVTGSTRCLMHGTSPLVFAEHVPIEQYPAAFGLHMLFYGLVSLISGPIIGLLRDVTGSYPLVFNLLIGLMVACAVSWILELFCMRRTKDTFSPKEQTEKDFNNNYKNVEK